MAHLLSVTSVSIFDSAEWIEDDKMYDYYLQNDEHSTDTNPINVHTHIWPLFFFPEKDSDFDEHTDTNTTHVM